MAPVLWTLALCFADGKLMGGIGINADVDELAVLYSWILPFWAGLTRLCVDSGQTSANKLADRIQQPTMGKYGGIQVKEGETEFD